MLPPSSSSDEGPAPRERDFDGRAGNNKNTRYPQERFGGGNGGDDGRDSRGRFSDDEETEAPATAPREGAGAGDGDDASPPRGTPQASSLERALSHSELEELGFAAHLLLKISSSPIKRARVDLVSFWDCIIFFFLARARLPSGFAGFFLLRSCRDQRDGKIVVNGVDTALRGLARDRSSPFLYQATESVKIEKSTCEKRRAELCIEQCAGLED